MDLDKLRNSWKSLGTDSDALEPVNRRIASELAKGRAVNAQQKLARNYSRSGLAGVLVVLLAPVLVMVLELPVMYAYIYGIFGVIMGLLNYRFSLQISKADYIALPVVEAMKSILSLRRDWIRLHIAGYTMGVIVLLTLLYGLLDLGSDAVAGFYVGLAASIPLVYFKERQNLRLIRSMQEEIRSCVEPDKA